MNGQFARRLGLTDDQVQKIRGILDKARSEALASIKEVLTEEQVGQLEQMRDEAVQPGRRMGGPALQGGAGGPVGRRSQQGMGPGVQARPRGQRPAGQPFAGGRGAGRGQRFQGGMNGPDAAAVPPTGGQNDNPGRLQNRNVLPIERMFDKADANQDGALTKEELRAFHQKMMQDQ